MSTTLMAQPNYGSVASSSSVVSTDADTDEEASTPQQITSLERISDARSRFSHTKALFQQLERCASDQLPSFYSPRLQRSATVPAQQAQLQLQQQQQKAECPAVPPKPAKKPIAQNVFIDNQKNRVGALKPNGSATDSKPLAANGGTPGSPLTQVARNFSQLANDLEILTNSPRNTGGISSKNRNAVTSPTDAGDALRGFNIMETSRTTETNEVDRSVANAGESYDAYWRDAAFYKRRLTGGDDKKANDKDGLTTLDVEENQDEEDDETGTRSESSGESIPSEPRPSTLPQNSVATPITIVASSPFRRQNTSNMSQTTNKSIAGPNNQTPNVRVFAQQMSKPCESNFERSFTAKKAMLNGNGDNTETKTGSQGQPSFALLRRSSQQQNHGKAPTTEQSIQSTASIGNAPIFKRQTSNPNIKLPFTSSLRKNGAETLPSLRDSDVSPDSPLSAPAVPFTEPPACDMVPVGAVKRAIDTWRGLSPDRDVLNRKVSFSTAPIKVFKTHGVDEYDRRNDEIDPVASCAEYELERRLDKMELFDVELTKGTEGLGVSIIGMGVGADAGLEKLGIFVKSITPGGAVHRDGRIRVCDQIVCVDGVSLVGVSQLFAAQTLRATSARVTFTIGRESNLEDSEIAQLIQQSLEQDRLKMLASVGVPQHPPSVNSTTQYLGGGTNVIDGVRNRLNVLLPTRTPPIAPVITSNAIVSDEEAQIRARINALEADLNGSHRIAEQMRNVLENTRTHYSQLESKYDEARVLLQNYQEREKALLEREETHVKRLREKDAQYGSLVHQLRGRIDELESRLEAMARQRASVVDGELSALRERLAACAAAKPDISAAANVDEKGNDIDAQTESTGTLTNDAANSVQKHPQRHDKLPQSSDAENDTPSSQNQQQPPPPLPQHRSTAPASGARAAGLSQRALSAAPPQPQPYERFVVNGVQLSDSHHIYMTSPSFFDDPQYGMSGPHSYDPYTGATYVLPSGAACESPVPRVSEPASPAMPSKFNGSNSGAQFRHISGGLIPPDTYHIVSGGGGSLSPGTPQPHQRNRILFPLRKRYIPSENEFWREDIEAQGLQVLQWNVDEVCQMLIHIGLDKYIPEFTVNEVTGPKFLDLDGNRLKAMGIYNHSDRSIIKKKIKTIKSRIERERKALERQSRARVAATQKASAAGLTKSSEAAGVMNASLLGAPPSAMKLISIRQ